MLGSLGWGVNPVWAGGSSHSPWTLLEEAFSPDSQDTESPKDLAPSFLSYLSPKQNVVSSAVRLPAEFEPMEALVLPAGLLAQRYPQVFLQMVELLQGHTTLVGLVNDARQRETVEKLLAGRKDFRRRAIRFVEIPHNTLWIRDYGPLFFRFPDAHPGAYDAEYPDPRRRLDDAVPARLAALFGASVFPLPMVLEGGNLLTNGRGLGLTTTQAVLRHGGPSASEASFRHLLSQCLGVDSLVVLEPLAGEPTGHVDMFACFTAPDTVVVGQYDPKEDSENAAVLDRNAALLADCRSGGEPLRVIRIPMPPHPDEIWRTYTNVVFANRLLLVPIYPTVDSEGTAKALEMYRRILPGWKVVGVDVSELIRAGGGLRCITLGVPAPTTSSTLGAAVGKPFPMAGGRLFGCPSHPKLFCWDCVSGGMGLDAEERFWSNSPHRR